MAPHRDAERQPNNLDEAPELLTQEQAASALGLSVDLVPALERDDRSFPRRHRLMYVRQPMFMREQLIRWLAMESGDVPRPPRVPPQKILARRSDTKDGILRDHVLYNLTEAANLIGVSVRTISLWRAEGILPAGELPGMSQRPVIWGLSIRRLMEATAAEPLPPRG